MCGVLCNCSYFFAQKSKIEPVQPFWILAVAMAISANYCYKLVTRSECFLWSHLSLPLLHLPFPLNLFIYLIIAVFMVQTSARLLLHLQSTLGISMNSSNNNNRNNSQKPWNVCQFLIPATPSTPLITTATTVAITIATVTTKSRNLLQRSTTVSMTFCIVTSATACLMLCTIKVHSIPFLW